MPPSVTQQALLPKLRFPEFREAGEWQIRSLANIADFFKGKGLPKSAITNNGQMTCIHYGELFTEYTEIIQTIKSRTNLAENFFMSVENDVLMPTSDVTPNGLAKAACLKLSNIILGGDILVIRTNKEKINGEFLARYIRHQEQKVLQLVSGSTVFHLYASSIEKLTLSFPEKKEQQKIADCFSSLDDLISAQAQKIDALKTHKKGLMQQLFPAEGETIPKLRFSDFREVGEWEAKKLGGLCDMQAGKFIAAVDISEKRTSNLYPCFGGNGLRGYTKTFNQSGRYSLIGRQGALCGNITLASGKFYATEHAVVTTPKLNIHTDWLFYCLNLLNLNRFATGQAQPGLSIEVLEKVDCTAPASIKEQKKIADCLSSLDDLISAQTQKLDALKNLKKGLMQQLFPAIDEVSA